MASKAAGKLAEDIIDQCVTSRLAIPNTSSESVDTLIREWTLDGDKAAVMIDGAVRPLFQVVLDLREENRCLRTKHQDFSSNLSKSSILSALIGMDPVEEWLVE